MDDHGWFCIFGTTANKNSQKEKVPKGFTYDHSWFIFLHYFKSEIWVLPSSARFLRVIRFHLWVPYFKDLFSV